MQFNVEFEPSDQNFEAEFESSDQNFEAEFGALHVINVGETGGTFIPDVSDKGIISWTNDKNLPNPKPVDITGPAGPQGLAGANGYTPQRGTDYFTEADKAEMVDKVLSEIDIPDGGGAVNDVLVNGSSVVDENGVATIPIAPTTGGVGLVRLGKSDNGNMYMGNSNGTTVLLYPVAGAKGFINRKAQGSQYSGVVNSANIDLAVKYAMTDGIGTAWTEAEQAAARARMGAVSIEEVLAALPIYDGEVESV